MLVLQHKFLTLTCPTVSRKLRIGRPLHFYLRKMTSKACLSELHTPKKGVVKDCSTDSHVGIEDYKSDPNRLQSLTAKELQILARTLGISARGNKSQLISALKSSFSTGNANDASLSVESAEIVDSKRMPSKRKTKSPVTTQDSSNVLNVSEKKQKRGRSVKESVVCTIEDDDTLLVATQKLKSSSGKTVLERRNSGSTKKVVTQSNESEVVVSLISNEPWSVLAHKKPQKDWVPYNPSTMRPPALTRDKKFLKLMSWNVNGLRALLKLESFSALELAQKEDFDVLCLQETKIQEKDVEDIKNRLIEGYDHSFWTCSVAKLGYSGTAIISRVKPISVKYGLGMPDHDTEGRLVTMEFDNFFLLCAYVPNSGDGLKRLTYRVNEWDQSLSNYMKELEKSKAVILTGDLNCAHQEIDIFNPAGNLRSAGFTVEERESFERNYLSKGFVDTFRKQHPNAVGYTYWGYRHNGRKTNKGWRLDYFLASECIADKVYDSYILPQVTGSDHCPIGLVLKL